MAQLTAKKTKLHFLGLEFEQGQDRSGPAQAPRSIRHYFSACEELHLDIQEYMKFNQNFPLSNEPKSSNKKVRCQKDMKKIDWSPYQKAHELIKQILQIDDRIPLINWGGDHSVAISTVGAFCQKYPEGYVLWIDAHADLNLPEYSPSGHLHGMPLSILLDLENIRQKYFPWIFYSLDPKQIIYVGLRELDPFEISTIKKLGIKTFNAQEVRKKGIHEIAKKIFALTKNYPLHISFDIDSLDPTDAPSTGLHVKDGLSLSDLCTLGHALSYHSDIKSIDVVEINPLIGNQEEVFKTNLAAVSFIQSIFCPFWKISSEQLAFIPSMKWLPLSFPQPGDVHAKFC